MSVLDFFKRLSAAEAPSGSLLETLAQPGPHERILQEHFGRDGLRYKASGPVLPGALIVVVFTNRSGSNLLVDYLRQTGRVAGGGEFLNHGFVCTQSEQNGLPRFPGVIRHLHQNHVNGSRQLALKASWDQLSMLLRWNIPAMFADGVKLLHPIRHDVLSQAVSYAIALQTQQWTSHQAAAASPVQKTPSLEKILRFAEEFHRANQRISLMAAAHELPLWQVSYELMSQDPAAHLPRIFRAADLVGPHWLPKAPSLSRQAGVENAELLSRLHQAIREASGGTNARITDC